MIDDIPLGCILLSVFAVFQYHNLFNDAVLIAQAQEVAENQRGTLGVAFLADIAHWGRFWQVAQVQGVAEKPRGPLGVASLADIARSGRFWQVEIANAVLRENAKIRIIPGEPDNKSAGPPSESEMKATIAEASDMAKEYKEYNGIPTVSFAGMEAQKFLDLISPDIPASVALKEARKFIGTGVNVPDPDEVLKTKTVPLSMDLMLWYLTIFVAAETAFILMALKEYLQDLAHVSDLTLMGMGGESTQWQSPSPS